MSVDKWAYDPETCEGRACPGDCDLCDIPNNPEKYGAEEDNRIIGRYGFCWDNGEEERKA